MVSTVTRFTSLEKELQETKQTLRNAVLKLVKKVKSLETTLKRKSKKVLISESEGEESEDQGRKIQDIDDDPLVSLVRESMKEKSTDFVTPTKTSGEAQEEEISPTILEVAKTLSKIDTGLEAEEEINTDIEEINTGIEEVSTGSTKVDSGTTSKRGQKEGKAPMVEEDIQATHKTKEQMRQEEAGLEEAIKLQAQLDEEVAKQIHLDKMIAKRMAEEEAFIRNQKKKMEKLNLTMSFGAMIKDFTREDLIELYRLVMQKYGTNRPEDAYDRVLWSFSGVTRPDPYSAATQFGGVTINDGEQQLTVIVDGQTIAITEASVRRHL
ncbi:hypothetical protein Tco_0248362 [Tanacetum coccineum]